MSVKKATFIYLAIIAILIVVVAAGRAILPAEYYYKRDLLAARYTYAIWLLKLLLYITPLYMVMMYILKVGENITLGKATIILIVSGAIIFVAFPTALSFLKPEHLAYLGIKPAYLEGIDGAVKSGRAGVGDFRFRTLRSRDFSWSSCQRRRAGRPPWLYA